MQKSDSYFYPVTFALLLIALLKELFHRVHALSMLFTLLTFPLTIPL
jgi:hypothetical protein